MGEMTTTELIDKIEDAIYAEIKEDNWGCMSIKGTGRAAIRAILSTVEARPTDDEAGRKLLYALEAAVKEERA